MAFPNKREHGSESSHLGFAGALPVPSPTRRVARHVFLHGAKQAGSQPLPQYFRSFALGKMTFRFNLEFTFSIRLLLH